MLALPEIESNKLLANDNMQDAYPNTHHRDPCQNKCSPTSSPSCGESVFFGRPSWGTFTSLSSCALGGVDSNSTFQV